MRSVRRQVVSTYIDEFAFDTEDSSPDFIVESFADWLCEYIDQGAEFTDGSTIQYGYSLLSCRVQSRILRLQAPDFQSMPIKWIDNLSSVFGIIAAHKYTPETFGFTPDIPSLGQSLIVGKRFAEMPMFAARLPPLESNPNDSGWFIGSNSEDVDNNNPAQLQLMSLYEAMFAVPHVLDFLSLPVGCQVIFAEGDPVVLKDNEVLEIPKDSYLGRAFSNSDHPFFRVAKRDLE